jgi:hypothetical protein
MDKYSWARIKLSQLLHIEEAEADDVVQYLSTFTDSSDTRDYLGDLLDQNDSETKLFINEFLEKQFPGDNKTPTKDTKAGNNTERGSVSVKIGSRGIVAVRNTKKKKKKRRGKVPTGFGLNLNNIGEDKNNSLEDISRDTAACQTNEKNFEERIEVKNNSSNEMKKVLNNSKAEEFYNMKERSNNDTFSVSSSKKRGKGTSGVTYSEFVDPMDAKKVYTPMTTPIFISSRKNKAKKVDT